MGDPVVGGVTVEIKGDPSKFDASLASAQARAQAFDQSASQAMGNVAKATGAATKATADLAAAQKVLTDAYLAGRTVTDKMIEDAGGVFAAQSLMSRASKDALASQLAGTAATDAGAKTIKALGNEAKGAADSLNKTGFASAGVTRELVVLGREAATGNFSRFGGSLTILAQRMGLLGVIINPITIGIAAFSGGVLAAVAAVDAYNKHLEELTNLSLGVGAAVGVSVQSIEAAATQIEKDTGQSYGAAEASVLALVETGKIGSASFVAFGDTVGKFAEATGQKAPAAAKELAAALADPAKNVDALNQKIGFLTGTQEQNIIELAKHGETAKADAEIMAALKDRLGDVTVATGILQGALNALADAWRNAGNGVAWYIQHGGLLLAEGMDPSLAAAADAEQAKADAATKAAQAKATATASANLASKAGITAASGIKYGAEAPFTNTLAQSKQSIEDTIGEINKGLHSGAPESADNVNMETDALARLQHALTTIVDPATKAHALALAQADAAGAVTKAQKEHAAQELAAANAMGAYLTPAEAAQKATDALAVASDRASKTGLSHAATLAREAAAMEANAAGALALGEAYLVSDQAAMKAEASRKASTDATRKGIDTEAQTRRQLGLTIAEEAATAGKTVAATRDQADAQRDANDALASGSVSAAEATKDMQQELVLRPLLAAQALAHGDALKVLTEIIKALRGAYKDLNTEQARGAVLTATEQQGDANAILELQLRLLNSTNQARAIAVAQLQAEQELKRQPVPVSPDSPAGKAFIHSKVQAAQTASDTESAQYIKAATDAVTKQAQAYEIDAHSIGMTFEAAAAYQRTQELINDAADRGIELSAAQRESIAKLGQAYGSATEQARLLAQQQQAAADAAHLFADSFETAMSAFLFEGKTAKDTVKDLAKTLGDAATQALFLGQGPLAGFFGTATNGVVGGGPGGALNNLFGSLFHVPGMGGAKGPTGTVVDPIYVQQAGLGGGLISGGSGGGGGGILDLLGGLFGNGSAAASADPSQLVGLFHDGIGQVGSGGARRMASPALFANAPRLHSGLQPDEFPAILQRGERVQSRSQVAAGRRGGTTVNVNVSGVQDQGAWKRNDRQIARQFRSRFGV